MTNIASIFRSLTIGLGAGLIPLLAALALRDNDPLPTVEILLPAVAVVVVVTLVHYWKTGLATLLRDYAMQVGNHIRRLTDQIAETQGLIQLTPYEPPYPMPFGGGWALTADAAALLAREVALNKPQVIVELGSGVSTVLLGRMLKAAGGGKLYSLDHDHDWAELTRRHVRASGVEEHVVVLEAPLSKQVFGDREYHWYTVPEAVRNLPAIDFLIIDGPPQSLEPNGTPRYPALPAFIGQLSPQAVIYVDDAKRPQEQAMIERWLRENPAFERTMHDTVPGTCLLRRRVKRVQ